MESKIVDIVSLIMPAHNAAGTIGQAILSVCAQTYPHWELLIIENGSIDATWQECQKFSDPRIVKIRLNETGVSNARNVGLNRAKGQYLCFLDADDLLPINSLQSRVQHMSKNSRLSFCDGLVERRSEDLINLLLTWKPRIPLDLYLEMHKIDACCFITVTWMIRRDHIGSLRFDSSWTHLEDRLFFLQLAQNGEYAFVNEVTYIYRKRNGSLMTNHRKLQAAYRRFLNFIKVQHQIDPSEFKRQHTFYRTMFFKTHLKTGRLLAAVHVLFERP